MKSLKRKALSNASALPAILCALCLLLEKKYGKYSHQYISHGAIATFAEYVKTKNGKKTRLPRLRKASQPDVVVEDSLRSNRSHI